MQRANTLLMLAVCIASCREKQDIEATHARYAPGQVWTYKTRSGEPTSRLTVLRIDKEDPLGFIVHVRVDGLLLKSPTAPGGFAKEIGHLPFAVTAIDESVIKMEGSVSVPSFREGYQTWRTAFDKKKAGVWSVPVAEAVAAMERILTDKR